MAILPETGVRSHKSQLRCEGGRRGMWVSVTLPEVDGHSVGAVEAALAAYLFETRVSVG
jgi:hypothetical protein